MINGEELLDAIKKIKLSMKTKNWIKKTIDDLKFVTSYFKEHFNEGDFYSFPSFLLLDILKVHISKINQTMLNIIQEFTSHFSCQYPEQVNHLYNMVAQLEIEHVNNILSCFSKQHLKTIRDLKNELGKKDEEIRNLKRTIEQMNSTRNPDLLTGSRQNTQNISNSILNAISNDNNRNISNYLQDNHENQSSNQEINITTSLTTHSDIDQNQTQNVEQQLEIVANKSNQNSKKHPKQ